MRAGVSTGQGDSSRTYSVILQVLFLCDVFALIHEDKFVSAGHEDDSENAYAKQPVVSSTAEENGDDGYERGVEGDFAHLENRFRCFCP